MDQQELKELLEYSSETGVFTWKVANSPRVKVGAIAGHLHRATGYIKLQINGKIYAAHRLAWLYIHGVVPPDQIDHMNHIRNDNRIINLRLATRQENNCNKSKYVKNTIGITGVTWDKAVSKWRCQITINQKLIYLGLFTNKEDAVGARKQSETDYGFHENHGKDTNK